MTGRFTVTGGTSHSFTENLSPGTSYNYYVRCRDQAQNINTQDYPILFSVTSLPIDDIPTPDITLPNISISYPINNSSIKEGALIIQASASDNVGVIGVKFYLNGTILDIEDTSYPWRINTTLTPGTYRIYTIARDTAGNKKTSSTVTFIVTKKHITDNTPQNLPKENNPETLPKPPKIIAKNTVEEFTRNLKLDDEGEDVRYLQRTLNILGYTVTANGPGSLGNEINSFNEQTKEALIRYQSAHSETGAVSSGILDNVTIFLIKADLANLKKNNPEDTLIYDKPIDQSDESPIWVFFIYIFNQIKTLFSKIFSLF